MSFKTGDKVICIISDSWDILGIKGDSKKVIQSNVAGPAKDEITTVSFVKSFNKLTGLGFVEYPGHQDLFDSRFFRKLSEIKDLQNYKVNVTILEDLSAPIKIGKGLPSIPKPQELEKFHI